MNTTGQRLVIDTDVFITILSKKGENRWIFDRIIAGNFVLCITNEILMEYWEILERKTNPEVARNVVDFLVGHPHVYFFVPYIRWNLIKEDEDDNKFPDCYLCSNAQFLISNDHHFALLKKLDFPKINLVSTKEFKESFV